MGFLQFPLGGVWCGDWVMVCRRREPPASSAICVDTRLLTDQPPFRGVPPAPICEIGGLHATGWGFPPSHLLGHWSGGWLPLQVQPSFIIQGIHVIGHSFHGTCYEGDGLCSTAAPTGWLWPSSWANWCLFPFEGFSRTSLSGMVCPWTIGSVPVTMPAWFCPCPLWMVCSP